jgi:hypothetical protein
MRLSHSQLRGWYIRFNTKWFDNRLPLDMDVFYAPSDGCHGELVVDGESRHIQIDTAIGDSKFQQLILLHEMTHYDTGDFGHGARFQAGMLRLAKAGAFRNLW